MIILKYQNKEGINMVYTTDLCIIQNNYIESGHFSDRDGSRAFDNLGTGYKVDSWNSDRERGGQPAYIGYNFGESKKIVKYTVRTTNSPSGAYHPKTWVFQGSVDGNEWINLHSVTNAPEWDSWLRREYTFSNTNSYLQYRLLISDNYSASYDWIMVDEIEMMEEVITNPYIRPDNISELYHSTKKRGLRGKAKQGFIRPTISEFFMSNCDYIEIPSVTVPGTPSISSIDITTNNMTINFTAPESDGGSPITQYTATSTPGNITASVSQAGSGSITVTGLSTGVDYTFVVYATNSIGNSANSASSNSTRLLEMLGYTGNLCKDGTATASDSDFNTSPANAFDDSIDQWEDWWCDTVNNDNSTSWIQYEFPSSKCIGKVGIISYDGVGYEAIKDFSIKASNTGSFSGEEVTLYTGINEPYWSQDLKEYTFSNLNEYKYYRIVITSNYSGNGNSDRTIQKIEMYESVYSSKTLTSPNDNFTGTTIDAEKWGVALVGNNVTLTQNDKILTAYPGGVQGSYVASTLGSKFYIYGDFDIQIDFNNLIAPQTDITEAKFRLFNTDLNEGFQLRRYRDASINQYQTHYKVNGVWTHLGSINTTDTYGKLRITRSSNSCTSYYWNNDTSAWVTLYSGESFHAPIKLGLDLVSHYDFPACSVEWDNFVVNSGVVYMVG